MLASCLNNLLNKRSDLEGIFSYGKAVLVLSLGLSADGATGCRPG